MATNSYSNLKNSATTWNKAIRKFGIVTVMNAKVYDVYDGMTMTEYAKYITGQSGSLSQAQLGVLQKINSSFVTGTGSNLELVGTAVIDFSVLKTNEIISLYLLTKEVARLKYLKTANATEDGPNKTITGGKNNAPLVKYGKTARLEMQDALGNAEALEALTGVTVEYFRTTVVTDGNYANEQATDVLHVTDGFAGHHTIIGDTFIVSDSGKEIPAYVIYYDFLSDSLLNLTQEADGDATVFDMNGDLIRTDILVGDYEATGDTDGVVVGDFYTILPKLAYETNPQVIEAASQSNVGN